LVSGSRRIFGLGGGGFTVEPENPVLDRFILSLAGRPIPRICFLPTASGDPDDHIARFHAAFDGELCEPSHLSLFRLGRRPVAVAEHLLSQDIIYVGGGSMVNLLAIWAAHELDRILVECWRQGIVLAGLSAGSMCWFEVGVTTSGGKPAPARGLGLLPGSNCVHYDGEPARRPIYLEGVRTGQIPGGFGVDDGVGLLFEGPRLDRVVTSRAGAHAYRVHARDGVVTETQLQPERLRAAAGHEAPADVVELRRVHALRRRG
jgi:dipeptidase E